MRSTLKGLLALLSYRLRRLAKALGPARLAATGRFLGSLLGAMGRRRREPLLTVAVDVSSFWEPLTGIGWYLYRLLEHLADREDLKLRLYGPTVVAGEAFAEPVVELPRGRALERVTYRVPDGLSLPRWVLETLIHRTRLLWVAGDGNRVIFAPNYLIPSTFRLCRGALVVTVHDLGYLEVPETLQEETLGILRRGMDRTFRRAKQVITPSRAVAREIVEGGLAGDGRVTAVHHGPGQLARIPAGELPVEVSRPYALFVGTVEPRKNLSTALEAWRRLRRERRSPPPLVVCGKLGWKAELIQPELDAAAREGWLVHLGYVDNPTLKALYKNALLVVFPSLYEGFGLPAVEAQQAGAPLVCSDLPVFREVAGEGALYAPATDPEAWERALCQLLDEPDLRDRLGLAGERSAEKFSWQRAAQSTHDVWRKAVG